LDSAKQIYPATVTLLLYFDDLRSDRKQTDSVYLDFSKAFDSVPHNRLLMKLWSVGITGIIWSWLQPYLSHWSQCVSINDCLSQFLPVKSGVPQGSILGPLMFIIIVNDLSVAVKNFSIFKFADNVLCFKVIHSKKCVVLHFKANNSTINVTSLFY